MSTTFAVPMSGYEPPVDDEGSIIVPDIDDDLQNGTNLFSEFQMNMVEIAYRSSQGITGDGKFWKMLHYFKPETKVYALDNHPQGIYTIADILKELID